MTFFLAEWERRRAADRDLDRRLGRLGYLPTSGYHREECAVGIVPKAPCTCREVVARGVRRGRSRRGRLLYR